MKDAIGVNARPISKAKKVVFSLSLIAALFIPLEFFFWSIGVETISQRRDPFVGFSKTLPLFVTERTDGANFWRTAPAKLAFFNEQRFPDTKPGGTYRVFCLGGSTTFGRPFDDRTSYVNWLRLSLAELDSEHSWEVINAGGISYASYRLVNLMEQLIEKDPDLFVIYTGHNEFLEKRTYGDLMTASSPSSAWARPLFDSRVFGVLDDWLNPAVGSFGKHSAGISDQVALEVDTILDHSVGPDAYSLESIQVTQTIEHFEYNLNRMIELAKSVDARILFVKPASNLKDFSPFKSEHVKSLDSEQQNQWLSHYLDAEKFLAEGSVDLCLQSLRKAGEIDASRADWYFLMGQLLHAKKQYAEANDVLQRAIDLDVCSLRATASIQAVVERVAIEHGVPLVDLPSILEAECIARNGHPNYGGEYFLDHVHPSVATHRKITSAILEVMQLSDWIESNQEHVLTVLEKVGVAIDASVDVEVQASALTNLAQVLSWAGKQDEAAPLAVKALQLRESVESGDDPESLFYAGAQYAIDGRDQDAVDCFERLLKMNPDHHAAQWRLASLLYDDEQFDRAATHFRIATQLDSEDLNSLRMLGFALVRAERWPEALPVLKEVLAVSPDDKFVAEQIRKAKISVSRSNP